MTISYLHGKILNRAELPAARFPPPAAGSSLLSRPHAGAQRRRRGGQGGDRAGGQLGRTAFPVQAGGSSTEPHPSPLPASPPPRPAPSSRPSPCGHLFSVLMSCPSGVPLSHGETGRNQQSLHHEVAHSQTTPFLGSRLPGPRRAPARLREAVGRGDTVPAQPGATTEAAKGRCFMEDARGTEREALPWDRGSRPGSGGQYRGRRDGHTNGSLIPPLQTSRPELTLGPH